MYGTQLREVLCEAMKLDNGDTQYGCGCVTFWGYPIVTSISGCKSQPTALYRKACGSHRRYAEQCGILVK